MHAHMMAGAQHPWQAQHIHAEPDQITTRGKGLPRLASLYFREFETTLPSSLGLETCKCAPSCWMWSAPQAMQLLSHIDHCFLVIVAEVLLLLCV